MEHRLTLPARTIGVALIAISSFLNAGENRWDNLGRTAAVAHLRMSPTGAEAEQAKPTSARPVGTRAAGLTLEALERMALANNPAIAQGEAIMRSAAARKTQAGLYPNPVVGATGDEISTGPVIRGGEVGGFVEQRIVTAGKLKRSRAIFEHEEAEAEASVEVQKHRVLTTVRTLFYRALGAERLVHLRGELRSVAREAVKTSRDLANVGQADQPDVLAAEIEAQRAELALARAKRAGERIWRVLASVVGSPSLQPTPLEGNLEETPSLDVEDELAKILRQSPEVRAARARVARAESALRRAQVEKIPDVLVRGGLRYNRELLERGGTPVGLEGFFDIGVEIPLFNRNQGGVAEAQANIELAEHQVERVRLSLRRRLATARNDYQDALDEVEQYRNHILPRARRAHELYLDSFRKMAAAYPQVLIAQRNLFQAREDYIEALVNFWQSVVQIRGQLLYSGV